MSTPTIWPTIADAIANSTHTTTPPLAWDPASHLLSRFAFGPTIGSRTYIKNCGADAWYK
jgi:hypothetical protein